MNITGSFAAVFDKDATPGGAFTLSGGLNVRHNTNSGSTFASNWISFNASRNWTGEIT